MTDSTKMWSTLKKIAEAELADSNNQAADSVTLRFLSLAPRVARLNHAVRVGLGGGSSAEAALEGDRAPEAEAAETGGEPGSDVPASEAPPFSRCGYSRCETQHRHHYHALWLCTTRLNQMIHVSQALYCVSTPAVVLQLLVSGHSCRKMYFDLSSRRKGVSVLCMGSSRDYLLCNKARKL